MTSSFRAVDRREIDGFIVELALCNLYNPTLFSQ